MIYTGARISLKLCCPRCGQPDEFGQMQVSDFFTLCCKNKDCDSYMAEVLIERRTGQVLSVQMHEFRDGHGKRWRVKYEEVPEGQP